MTNKEKYWLIKQAVSWQAMGPGAKYPGEKLKTLPTEPLWKRKGWISKNLVNVTDAGHYIRPWTKAYGLGLGAKDGRPTQKIMPHHKAMNMTAKQLKKFNTPVDDGSEVTIKSYPYAHGASKKVMEASKFQ